MGSGSEIKAQFQPTKFSDVLLLHYFTTICIAAFVGYLFSVHSIYGCLSSGNDWECTYDPAATGVEGSNVSKTFLIFDALFLAAFATVVSSAILLLTSAPIFVLAFLIGRRYEIRRNITGIFFWIGTWMLAFLTLPIMSAAAALFDPGHVSWASDLAAGLGFATAGLICGTVNCALAFLHRDRM